MWTKIYKPLEILFKSCLESNIFPLEWKKVNVIPVYKKSQTIARKLPVNHTSLDMWKNISTSVI